MNFGNGVEKLQKEYPNYIVIVKNGVFYNAIGKDAIYLENKINLVKTCFGKDKCKCGIPKKAIGDFIERLNTEKIKYIVFDYIKGKDLDFEEQFIEKYRNDNGRDIAKEKQKLELECENCFYNKNKKIVNVANGIKNKNSDDYININEKEFNVENEKFIASMVKKYIDGILNKIINEVGNANERRR